MRQSRLLIRWAAPALALPMLALTLTPAEVWKPPIDDAVYSGFDSNLIYASGAVRISPSIVDARASANAITTVNLATTQRQKIAASVDVVVATNDGASQPFRFGVWSPWTNTGYFIVFGPPPDDGISVETVSAGAAGSTLLGGDPVATALAKYELNQSYNVVVQVDRAAGVM